MFTENPNRNLKDGEELLREIRRSLWSFLTPALLAVVCMLAPFFFLFPLLRLGRWGLAAFLLLLVIGCVTLARLIVLYRGNLLIITTERLIDVDQKGFFSHVVSETTYDKVQDVSYSRKGIWQMVSGTGTVTIQTAGAGTNLEIRDVREPASVHELIMNVQRERMHAAEVGETLSAQELVHLIERIKKGLSPESVRGFVRRQMGTRDDREDRDVNRRLRR